MNHRIWSFMAGLLLTGGCVAIGLWANLTVHGDPLAAAELAESGIDSTTVLMTTLFIGLSGGHYIGGSFDKESKGRWFAIGANCVLWSVLLALIIYRGSGGEILQPAIYGLILFTVGGGVFSLHKSGVVEDASRLDQYIGHFSSKGTAIVVFAAFTVRILPDPTVGFFAILAIVIIGLLLWNAYKDQINDGVELVEGLIDDLTTTKDRIRK